MSYEIIDDDQHSIQLVDNSGNLKIENETDSDEMNEHSENMQNLGKYSFITSNNNDKNTENTLQTNTNALNTRHATVSSQFMYD